MIVARFDKTITLGNILTILSMVAAVVTLCYGAPGDAIRVEARVTALESANVMRDRSESQFQVGVINRLDNLQTDIRELRAQGFKFSELPPSPYHRGSR